MMVDNTTKYGFIRRWSIVSDTISADIGKVIMEGGFGSSNVKGSSDFIKSIVADGVNGY